MEALHDQVVRDRLDRSLQKWRLDGGQLVRSYKTGDWRRTNLLAGAIAFLAESAYHHPDLELGFTTLVVHLSSHDAGGITERDLQLAQRIEDQVTWAPASDSVFTGPPDGWIE